MTRRLSNGVAVLTARSPRHYGHMKDLRKWQSLTREASNACNDCNDNDMKPVSQKLAGLWRVTLRGMRQYHTVKEAELPATIGANGDHCT